MNFEWSLLTLKPRMNATATNSTQELRLAASASVDEDDLDDDSFEFSWDCENGSGDPCFSRAGDSLLGLASSVSEAVLSIPAGSLPIGELLQ